MCSYHFFCCLDASVLFFGLYLKGIWIFAFSALDRILPVVSYGRGTWSVTLKEEHRLMVFENRVQRKILESERDKLTGDWMRQHNEQLHDLYCSLNIIQVVKSIMGWAGRVACMGGAGGVRTCFWWGN